MHATGFEVHIFFKYSGSVHDSRVSRALPLLEPLQEKCNYIIIEGGSGYPYLRHGLRSNLFSSQRQFVSASEKLELSTSKNMYIYN